MAPVRQPAVSKKLTDRGIALDAAPYQALSSGIIRHFVDRWVGPEPVNDGNLVRDTVSCGCGDCEDLNAFLASPTRGEGFFSMKESRRKHLYWKLTGGGIDCSTDTERGSVPYTLVVTKTFAQFRPRHNAWVARARLADETFWHLFGGQQRQLLRTMLGAVEHDRISGLLQPARDR